jgi:hypothetical protein
MAFRSFIIQLATVIWLTINSATILFACAPAPRNGQFVTINEEAAVIVWDAKTKTEHFIRMASFSGAEDFGFLVPTPTKPDLAAAPNAKRTVSALIEPKFIHKPHFDGFDFTPLLFRPMSHEEMRIGAVAGDVRVLEERQVAGFDAAILEADNADSLNEWLAKHGYESRPALIEWIEPYVKAKWKITAFKLAANGNRFATQPVRMSFTTERPFFPYREPSDLRDEKSAKMPRTLKVFLLSDARMQGSLGTQQWPGEVVWANQVETNFHPSIANDCGLKPSQLPANLWLTTFEDKASPRPGIDDVFFASASVQNITVPPPIVVEDDWQFPLPLDVLLLILALLGFGWWRWKRKATRLVTS